MLHSLLIQSVILSPPFRAFEHIAKYINKTSKIYPVCVGEEYAEPMSAYPCQNKEIEGFYIDNNDGKDVFVLINPNTDKRQAQLYFNDKWWYTELWDDSISTLIMEQN